MNKAISFIILHAPYMTYVEGYTERDMYFFKYNIPSAQWIISVNNFHFVTNISETM